MRPHRHIAYGHTRVRKMTACVESQRRRAAQTPFDQPKMGAIQGERMHSSQRGAGTVLLFRRRSDDQHGSGTSLLTQHTPGHVLAKLLAGDNPPEQARGALDVGAVLGRNLPVCVEPGPDARAVREAEHGCQGSLPTKDLSSPAERLLFGSVLEAHEEVYASHTPDVNASQTSCLRTAYRSHMEQNMHDKATLGPRLKAARVRAELTQDAAATRLGLKKATISSWETSRNIPDALTLGRIARLYGTTTDSLLWDVPYSSEAAAVAAAFESMSAERREAFLAMWRIFVGMKSDDTESGYKLPPPINESPVAAQHSGASTRKRSA